jgi:serine/threonine protein kinase
VQGFETSPTVECQCLSAVAMHAPFQACDSQTETAHTNVGAGRQMRLSFTLWYAAPETIIAFKTRQRYCTAAPSTDLFAYGIICYELLTGKSYYPSSVTTSEAAAMLTGRSQLPHESMSKEDGIKQLGILREYDPSLNGP